MGGLRREPGAPRWGAAGRKLGRRGEGTALNAADAAARKRIETLAMRAVIDAEEAKGRRVVDVAAQKCGWDVSSYPPNGSDASKTL